MSRARVYVKFGALSIKTIRMVPADSMLAESQ